MTDESRLQEVATVTVRPACDRCGAPGQLVKGAGRIARRSRSGLAPNVVILWYLLGVAPVAWALAVLVRPNFPVSARALLVPVAAALGVGVWLAVSRLPAHALVCSACRRATHFCAFRRIPFEWQEMMVPRLHCVRCGFTLIGSPEPRCPECGTPFPEEWRKITDQMTDKPVFATRLDRADG